MSGKSPWFWVPTLYLAEGFPYAVVTTLSVILFKTLGSGFSDTAIAFWTSLLGLPWVLKPFWAPCIDLFGKKRSWILSCQALTALLLLLMALTVFFSPGMPLLTALFFLAAFASATHDAAADGFYIIGLSEHDQAFFSGIRNTFYRLSLLAAQGVLLSCVFSLTKRPGWGLPAQWAAFLTVSGAFFVLLFSHHLFALPHAAGDLPRKSGSFRELARSFGESFLTFFRKKHIVPAILFLLFYRFAEAQLSKVAALFLVADRATGGIALDPAQYANLYGSAGMLSLLAGGIFGGILVAKQGLGKMLLPMALLINLPDAVYVYLAFAQPHSLWNTGICIALEQFGYGFGFTAYTVFMLHFAEDSGPFRTTHYAFMTGIMALSLMLPGMVSGALLEHMHMFQTLFASVLPEECGNYELFFLWIMLCTIPGISTIYLIRPFLNPDFGKKCAEKK